MLAVLTGCENEVIVIPFGSAATDTGADVTADDVSEDGEDSDAGGADTALADDAPDAATADTAADDAVETDAVETDAVETDAGDDVGPADTTPTDTTPTDVNPADTGVADTTPDDTGSDALDGADIEEVTPDDWTVSISTFNVERFFDTVCDSGSCGFGDFESQPSVAQFEYKAQQLADAIEGLNVDIAVIQEVENLTCLEALRDALGWTGAIIIGETGYAASVDVAVIAQRGTLLNVIEHRDMRLIRPDGTSTSFAREFLEVHLEIDERRVIVFAAHFKSKNSDDPGRRYAEGQAAGAIVSAVADAYPDAVVVLGGDLNDTPGSDPITALETGTALFRVASLLGDRDGTYRYLGTDTAIDHLYLSQAAAGVVVPGTVQILRDASGGYGGSDHAALRATFGVE